MAVYQAKDSTVSVDENSVDQLFETLKGIRETSQKAEQARLEHLDTVNNYNLESMNKYVQGQGSAMVIDATTNKLRPLTYEEQVQADGAKAGIQASKIKQMQEMQALVAAHNQASAVAAEPQIGSIGGHVVKMGQTAAGGQDMTPMPNAPAALPAANNASQMRLSVSNIGGTGGPTFGIKEVNTPKNSATSEALAKERMTLAQAKRQDILGKQYRDTLQKVLSYRSGGLGIQDAKVNQAVDLRTLADQYKDPQTGEYNIPPSQHAELILGLAKLLSPTGVVAQAQLDELKAKTQREGVSKTLIYLGFDPQVVGGPTKSVIRMLVDSIDRQGLTAEKLRDKYINGSKELVPKGLDSEEAKRLAKVSLTNSFADYLKQSEGKTTAGANTVTPSYDPKTQRLQRNKKTGEFRVVSK